MVERIIPSKDKIKKFSLEKMRAYEDDFLQYFLYDCFVDFFNKQTFPDGEDGDTLNCFSEDTRGISERLGNLLEEKLKYFFIENDHLKQKIYDLACEKMERINASVKLVYDNINQTEDIEERKKEKEYLQRYINNEKIFTERNMLKKYHSSNPASNPPRKPLPASKSVPRKPLPAPNKSATVYGPKSSSKSVSKKSKLLHIDEIPKSKSKSNKTNPKSKSGHKTRKFPPNEEGRCGDNLFYDPTRKDNKPCLELDKCAEDKFKGKFKQCKAYKKFNEKNMEWLLDDKENKKTNRLGRNIDYFSVNDLKKLIENLRRHKGKENFIKQIEDEIGNDKVREIALRFKESKRK